MSIQIAESLGVTHDREHPTIKPKKRLEPILYTLFVISILIFHFCFKIVNVSGTSMDPTLHDKQLLIATTVVQPKRGDIVVLKERLREKGETNIVIKRLIAIGGDTVELKSGVLYVNGQLVNESYISESPLFRQSSFTTVVPQGHYFVMGDNRDNSRDSRLVGNFKTSSLIGVILFK